MLIGNYTVWKDFVEESNGKITKSLQYQNEKIILIEVVSAKDAQNSHFMSSVCFLYTYYILQISVIFKLLTADPIP